MLVINNNFIKSSLNSVTIKTTQAMDRSKNVCQSLLYIIRCILYAYPNYIFPFQKYINDYAKLRIIIILV